MSLFNILVDIAARTANFEAGMLRVEKRLDSFSAGTKKLAQTAGGLLGVTVGFEAVRQAVTKAVARGDELSRLAERMDTTAKSLSQLEYAAKKSDMEFGTFAGNIDTFTKNVGMAAAGTGKAQKALRELGISAKVLAGLGLDEQLDLIANAIARISNPTRQQTLTSQLFGDANMLSVLKDGAAGLRALREESDHLGFSLENEAAEKLAKADDAMKALDVSTTALTATLAVGLAPALTQVINGFNAWTSGDFTKNLRAQMADLAERRNELLAQQRNIKTNWLSKFLLGDNVDSALKSVETNIAAVEAQMNRINDLMQKGSAAAANATGAGGDTAGFIDLSAIDRRLDTMSELAENIAYFEQIDKDVEERLAAMRQHEADLAKTLNDGIESSVTETNRRAAESIEEVGERIGETINATNEMTEFARQAAANMQTHFANFLFDPFQDGLRGMAKGFLDTIRRMLAEAAAAKLLETLFGKTSSKDGGFFGTILNAVGGSFGGGKAKGGPLQQSKWYIAGEHGPEPIWGGGAGAYAAGYGGGGGNVSVSPVYNIDARGATMELAKALPGILKQNNESLKADIIVGLQRRKYKV